MKNKNKKFTKGFTLIELLVVVLIIGVLAAIALPQYKKAVERARMTEAIIMVKKIAEAQQRYYMVNGDYTRDINELDIDFEGDDVLYDESIPAKQGEYFIFSASNSVGQQNAIAVVAKKPQLTKYSLGILKNSTRYCYIYKRASTYEIKMCNEWANGKTSIVN